MIKSILVHLADDARHLDRLRAAVDLARAFDAHVDLVYVTYPVVIPAGAAGRTASQVYISERMAASRRRADQLRHDLEGHFAECREAWTYHVEDGNHHDAMARHAHLSDIVVLGQSTETFFEDRFRTRLTDHMLLSAGCPILILPGDKPPDAPAEGYGPIGRNILIGWTENRGSMRALRDALPLLRRADEVHVATPVTARAPGTPGGDIDRYLEVHGVANRTVHTVTGEGEEAGAALVSLASDVGADLLVTGAYGHSRLHEVLMGGTTRHLLRNSTLPLLMSH
ncbi:MAG: universal stress protein [Alphaproteobacteria bacterium]|nr:universal stress protein [Alphaproteobacteria bacterium]